jgi:P-type Cu2+ transporter
LQVRVTGGGQGQLASPNGRSGGKCRIRAHRYTTIAERAAAAYAPTFPSSRLRPLWSGWISGGDLRLSMNIAVASLIITCPCALGLAVPAVVTSASGKLFRKGLLIKDGTALERLAEVDTVSLTRQAH